MLIFTLLFSILLGQSEIDPSKYYCKTNYELKILKLSNDDLIFYGSEGGVLRTTGAGISWEQNYSGTHDKILKLIEHKNIIYGITQTGSFMSSNDKGDWWKYNKIGNILTDFTILNDIIYVTSNTDTIFVSSDLGKTWESKVQNQVKNISGISRLNNKLILNGNNIFTKLFIFNQDLIFDKEILTPFNFNFSTDKFNYFYIKDGTRVAKLKDDLSWESYKLFDDLTDFKIYIEENQISIFVYNISEKYNPKIDFYLYDLNSNLINYINSYSNNQMNVYSFFYTEFKSVDVEKINDEYIMSNHHKTIFKIDKNNNWELLSNASTSPARNYRNTYDKVVYGSGFGIVIAKDYGTIYQFKPFPIIKFNDYNIRPSLQYIEFIDKYSAFIVLQEYGLNQYNNSMTNIFRFAYTKDDFNTVNITDNSFSAPFLGKAETNCLGKIQNSPIINRTFLKLTTVPDKNGIFQDSLYYNCLYKFDIDDERFDSLNTIIDSLQLPNLYAEEGKIWIYGTNSISKKNAIIYLSEDSGLTFKRVADIDISTDGINYPYYYSSPVLRRSKDGNLYLLTELLVSKINEDNYTYTKIPNNNFSLYSGRSNSDSGYLEDYIFSLEMQKDTIKELVDVYVEIKDDIIEIQKLFIRKDLYYLTYSKNNDYIMLAQSVQAMYERLLFPIEEERLNYYTSVEELTPPSIWTYPPYPNPVKDMLKMKFYSAIMGQIANLKVELIEIGSGRVYNINDYKLSKTDDYFGEIDIDISNYNSGAYLINFKLGESNKSESIIIE